MNAPNIDNGIEQDTQAAQFPVMPDNFTDVSKLPIFWGPGQILDPGSYPNYKAPDITKWIPQQPLFIPQVCRFISSTDTTYDKDSYPKPGGGGPTPRYTYIVNVILHDPRFDGSFMIYVADGTDASPPTIPSSGTGAFSVIPYTTGPAPTYGYVDVTGIYLGLLGQRFAPTHADAPLTFAIDWIYNGIYGAGFYYRDTGHLAVPV